MSGPYTTCGSSRAGIRDEDPEAKEEEADGMAPDCRSFLTRVLLLSGPAKEEEGKKVYFSEIRNKNQYLDQSLVQ